MFYVIAIIISLLSMTFWGVWGGIILFCVLLIIRWIARLYLHK